MNEKKSTIPKFYRKSIEERRDIISNWTTTDSNIESNLSLQQANEMIENVIDTFNLPFGIATNFLINSTDRLIPMVVEEPSIVAAVSNAAKLFRQNGGFLTSSTAPLMIGQIQLLDIKSIEETIDNINSHKETILAKANEIGGSIVRLGGGAKNLEYRIIEETSVGTMIIVHLIYDTRDAMGANAVNTAVEHIAPYLEEITGNRVNLKILSNLSDKRKARATGKISAINLTRKDMDGEQIIDRILEAATFADVDSYRATTHNKGIMNGIDAVAIATGNDWRAIEAGAHAFAARHGHYSSLTKWHKDDTGTLFGELEIPMAVGTVGGATRVHPKAQLALDILGVTNAQMLAEIMTAVGLAQNFAALLALATDGIQKGHMRMHARQLAAAAGAAPEEVAAIAQAMINEKNIRLERAKSLVKALKENTDDR